MRLADLQSFAQGFDPGGRPIGWVEAVQQLQQTEREAIERAVAGWAAQAGVTVEEWAKSFGFQVRHIYEGTTVTVRVEPVALGFDSRRTLTRVVFPQPRESTAR